MTFNKTIRQLHRWLSIAFTLAVLVNLAAMGGAEPALWIGLLALVPLILLLISGLYLFVLPYLEKGRQGSAERVSRS
jgi:hypothetical protein